MIAETFVPTDWIYARAPAESNVFLLSNRFSCSCSSNKGKSSLPGYSPNATN
jgi:hypothetical protein